MQKLKKISVLFLLVGLFVLVLNSLFISLPDWAVRFDGSIVLVALFFVIYATRRLPEEDDAQSDKDDTTDK